MIQCADTQNDHNIAVYDKDTETLLHHDNIGAV